MKTLLTFITILFLINCNSYSQVGISQGASSPDPSAMLDISSQNGGFLAPRMSMSDRDGILSPASSLLIYQTDNEPGYYYNAGTPSTPEWVKIQNTSMFFTQMGKIPIDTLPYTITTSGSYIVIKELSSSTTGLVVNADFVSIDLNGHTLEGLSGNTSAGIQSMAGNKILHIGNGFITGWSLEGINATNSFASSFFKLDVSNSTLDGLKAGPRAILSHIIASGNGADGIDVDSFANISHSIAHNNSSDGIEADFGSNLSNLSVSDNSSAGIRSGGGNVIHLCTSSNNNSHGFTTGSGTLITNNVSVGNGGNGFYLASTSILKDNNSRFNSSHGFQMVGTDCLLEGNNAQGNTKSGFFTTFDRNTFNNNTSIFNTEHGFSINGPNNLIIKNSGISNGISNFNLVGSPNAGPIVTPATMATNTNPYSNFSNI